MVNIGIVGTGFMAKTHCQAYEVIEEVKKIKILTLPDNLLQAKEWALKCSKIDSIYTDVDSFFSSDINAIDICTPTPTHREFILKAIEKTKDILCEKPLTLTLRTSRQLVKSSEKKHLVFMVANVIRFWAEYKYLKMFIDEKKLGCIRNISMFRYSPMPEWGVNQWFKDLKMSGGALFDLHIHDIDYLQFVLGKPKKLSGKGFKRDGLAYTDINTTMEFGNDICATVYASYEMPQKTPFRMGYSALFEKGLLLYDNWRTPTLTVYDNNNNEETVAFNKSMDGYASECDYFVNCVVNKKLPIYSSVASAANTIEILEKISKSADKKREMDSFLRFQNPHKGAIKLINCSTYESVLITGEYWKEVSRPKNYDYAAFFFDIYGILDSCG